MGIIYSIINTTNNKAYIGQTIRSLEERKQGHLKLLRVNKHFNVHLQSSFNKYGIESFEFVVLMEVANDKLDKKEVQLISLFNTTDDRYGYNMTTGGSGIISSEAQLKNKISNQEKWPNVLKISPTTLEILDVYAGQNEAARENNIPVTHIGQACHFKGGKRHGYYWIFEDDYKNWKPPLQHRAKPYCLVNEKNIIQYIFRSESEMEKRAYTSKIVIKKRTNTNTPLMVNNVPLFIRSMTHEEYYSYNIGTCIDYPR